MALAVPEKIAELIAAGALVVINDSGGKDSQAMRILVSRIVPREQLVVVHASLGEAEWPGALEHARDGAAREGLPFVVARAVKSFFEMVESRFAKRPDVPSFPSASTRQCTSDLKRGPIAREVRRLLAARGGRIVIDCQGLRAQESSSRAKLEVVKRDERHSVAGREWWTWLPIHNLSRDEVFAVIAEAGETPHPAYAAGNERLSCVFCIMGSKKDLRNGALLNPDLYRRYVELERKTGYTMHMSRIPLVDLTGVACGGAL